MTQFFTTVEIIGKVFNLTLIFTSSLGENPATRLIFNEGYVMAFPYYQTTTYGINTSLQKLVSLNLQNLYHVYAHSGMVFNNYAVGIIICMGQTCNDVHNNPVHVQDLHSRDQLLEVLI